MSKYYLHIEAKSTGKVAKIFLVDRISEYGDSSANRVRETIESLSTDVQTAEVYINTKGGSVIETREIINLLKNRFKTVNIQVGAIAASAGTRILAEFPNAKAYPTSQFMIHKPKMAIYGNEGEVKANLKVLKATTEDYKKAYAKKFKKTEDEIENLWAKGDYWMNAEEALKIGLISEIIQENPVISSEDVAILEACGAPTIPAITKQQQSNTDMDLNAMRSALGLDANATEQQVLEAAKAAKQKADGVEALEAQAAKDKKTKAQVLVEAGIQAKKIPADKKEAYVALAMADYDNAKAAIDSMQAVGKLSEQINPNGSKSENRDDWDLDAWLEKDPEGLDAMADSDPEKFAKLNNLEIQ